MLSIDEQPALGGNIGRSRFLYLDNGPAEFAKIYGIWTRQAWARWTGVVIASIHAIVVLADMQAYPLWSLALFALDLLIIYGLVAHGGRARTPAT